MWCVQAEICSRSYWSVSLSLTVCLILIWCLKFGILRTFLWPSWAHLQPLHVSTSAEATSSLLPLKNEMLNPGLLDPSYRPRSVILRQPAQRFLTSRDENCGLRCYLMPESTILPATKVGLQTDATICFHQPHCEDSLSIRYGKCVTLYEHGLLLHK